MGVIVPFMVHRSMDVSDPVDVVLDSEIPDKHREKITREAIAL
jgi:hypothetical protein